MYSSDDKSWIFEIFQFIINVENSFAALYFCGNPDKKKKSGFFGEYRIFQKHLFEMNILSIYGHFCILAEKNYYIFFFEWSCILWMHTVPSRSSETLKKKRVGFWTISA